MAQSTEQLSGVSSIPGGNGSPFFAKQRAKPPSGSRIHASPVLVEKKSRAPRDLGNRVRQLRNWRGWSQERLAEQADIQRTYLAEIELGKRNPSLKHLQELAKAFRVGIAALFLNDA